MEYSMFIFDRWGNLIWESHDPSVGWDGTYNNSRVKTDTYTWKLSVKDEKRSTVIYLNGHVNVLF
jgi:gliding motility-associated-like protein